MGWIQGSALEGIRVFVASGAHMHTIEDAIVSAEDLRYECRNMRNVRRVVRDCDGKDGTRRSRLQS